MGAQISSVPRDPFNPNRFLSADAPALDKQVRFDEHQPASANPVVDSTIHRSQTAGSSRSTSTGSLPRQSRWPPSSPPWRRAVSFILALVGVAALLSAFTSYHGESLATRLFGKYARPSLLYTVFPLSFGAPSDPRTTVADNFLARALPIGRYDYALSANGGKIFLPLTTPFDDNPSSPASLSIDSILTDDARLDGSFSSPGAQFQVGISFATTIYPTHFTIDHAFSPDKIGSSNAPRHIVFWGVVEGVGNKGRVSRVVGDLGLSDVFNRTAPNLHQRENFLPLATAEYDVRGSCHVQTFAVHPGLVESNIDFGVVVLEVLDNWGGEVTQLYRVRVHDAGPSTTAALEETAFNPPPSPSAPVHGVRRSLDLNERNIKGCKAARTKLRIGAEETCESPPYHTEANGPCNG
ncbi:hypothetical protein GSI_14463 [Ganoderma sinense ZZ0214-1]|uniref:SUN domain-containing protein n=1 Tax=Ganoderma sinense ZZ0214-1 TaxID=1077348 RepID=A0A2G8RNQ7_9APHY|nr:hypothetical protein GSI_14463 [Ganoderma sinense ZZ0214-1]